MSERYDAVVVGSGPNGLAAAIEIARHQRSVLVIEGGHEVGGGSRTAELTRPGFLHDVCSAIHPAAITSPYFTRLPLAEYGLEWAHPEIALAHPLDGGRAALMHRDRGRTAAGLGSDGDAWLRSMGPVADRWGEIASYALGPTLRVPRHPLAVARFGLLAVRSVQGFARRFQSEEARALWAGLGAHSTAPLHQPFTAAVGLGLAAAGHAAGWPAARGGSQSIVAALASYLLDLGGEVRTGQMVTTLDDLPEAKAVLLSVTPRQLLALGGDRWPRSFRRTMARFRYGPGACKVDWALSGPIPWEAEAVRRAGTVHVGGTFDEIATAEEAAWQGSHPDRPFLILAQQSVFDPSRAPTGKHTGWAYCHVPNGSDVDMTERIEEQVDRFAPGFRDRIIARHAMTAADYEAYNPAFVGGDIASGASTIRQLLFRPRLALSPHRTALPGVYLCGASTSPGGGVHGMAGYHAARAALSKELAAKR